MEFLTSPQTYIIVHRLSMGHQAVMFLSTTMSEFYKLKKLWNRYIWTLFIVSKRIPWLHHSTPAGGVPPVGARSVILLPTYWVSVTWADIERPHWVGWEPQPVKVQHKHRRRELCPVHTLTLKTLVNSTLHTYKTSHNYTENIYSWHTGFTCVQVNNARQMFASALHPMLQVLTAANSICK